MVLLERACYLIRLRVLHRLVELLRDLVQLATRGQRSHRLLCRYRSCQPFKLLNVHVQANCFVDRESHDTALGEWLVRTPSDSTPFLLRILSFYLSCKFVEQRLIFLILALSAVTGRLHRSLVLSHNPVPSAHVYRLEIRLDAHGLFQLLDAVFESCLVTKGFLRVERLVFADDELTVRHQLLQSANGGV